MYLERERERETYENILPYSTVNQFGQETTLGSENCPGSHKIQTPKILSEEKDKEGNQVGTPRRAKRRIWNREN